MRGEGARRVRRETIGVAAGVLVAAAAGGMLWALTPLAGGRTDQAGPPGTLPDVVSIVCDGSGTRVLTPEVRPRADGLHVQVDNRLGEPVSIVIRSAFGDVTGLGAGPGPSEVHASGARGGWSVPPGAASVRCELPARDAGGEGGWVELRIVDQDSFYVPSELGCADTSVAYLDHAPGTQGEVGDPVEVVRGGLRGLLDGDVVEVAGYPEYGTEALVRVMRAGRIVAVVHLSRTTAGGWLLDRIVRCPDAGVGA